MITSAKLVPELQHWFYTFSVSSSVNQYQIPAPVDIDEFYLPQNSFIELLFNENYNKATYEYRYVENPSWGCVPAMVVERLGIYPGAGRYMKLSPDGTNFFHLQAHDFLFLDVLLQYRQDSTSVNIIDSTAGVVSFSFDSTTNLHILTVDYTAIASRLAKLIFLYLDLKVRGRVGNYNDTDLICQTLLEGCYEALVLDEIFKFVSSRGT